jgi:hypothetical protein
LFSARLSGLSRTCYSWPATSGPNQWLCPRITPPWGGTAGAGQVDLHCKHFGRASSHRVLLFKPSAQSSDGVCGWGFMVESSDWWGWVMGTVCLFGCYSPDGGESGGAANTPEAGRRFQAPFAVASSSKNGPRAPQLRHTTCAYRVVIPYSQVGIGLAASQNGQGNRSAIAAPCRLFPKDCRDAHKPAVADGSGRFRVHAAFLGAPRA